MTNTVIAIKKSSTSSATPSSLEFGELAINYADGKLFYKAANGSIYQLNVGGGGGGGDAFGTVNANGTLIVADTTNDVLTIDPGAFITIVGDAVNDKLTISAAVGGIYDTANAAFNKANTGGGGTTAETLSPLLLMGG
jgi:hypothetical protein